MINSTIILFFSAHLTNSWNFLALFILSHLIFCSVSCLICLIRGFSILIRVSKLWFLIVKIHSCQVQSFIIIRIYLLSFTLSCWYGSQKSMWRCSVSSLTDFTISWFCNLVFCACVQISQFSESSSSISISLNAFIMCFNILTCSNC